MVFVMYHGDLKQTYSGKIRPETYAQLKKKIPTLLKLDDLLDASKLSVAFLFDVKCNDAADDLISYFKHKGLPSSAAFTTPHVVTLNKLRLAFPYAMTLISQPYQEGPIKAIELARDSHFTGISLNKWWLGPLPYFLCKHYGKTMMVYTIDNPLWQWFAQTFFPNILLCTNHPERYRKLFPK